MIGLKSIFKWWMSTIVLKFDCDCAAAPNYAPIAAANDKATEMSYQAATDRLNFDKQQYADSQPYINRAREIGLTAAQQQMGVAANNQQKADSQWNTYQQTYRPIEQQSALESMGIRNLSDSDAARLTYLMGEGGANMDADQKANEVNALVQKSTDGAASKAVTNADAEANSAMSQSTRALARMGVDPSKIAANATSLTNNATLAKINAGEQARQGAVNQGVTLRAGQENFGKGATNTAATAYGLTLNAGNSATGNANASANAGLPAAQLVDGGYGGIQSAAQQQINANLGYGNMITGGYGDLLKAQTASNASSGQAMGAAAGMAAMFAFSSRRFKHGGKPVDGDSVLNKIDKLDIERWIYNEGVADEGAHVGPYAEDVNREFGDAAAPHGKVIDLVTMQGINLAAIKALNSKLDHIESRLGMSRKAA